MRAAIILAIIAVLATGSVLVHLEPPPYPDSWDGIELGFTETEARAAVSDLDPAFRDIKGFDQAGVDHGDRYWGLLVTYDEAGLVNLIEKEYVHRKLGLLNRSIRSER